MPTTTELVCMLQQHLAFDVLSFNKCMFSTTACDCLVKPSGSLLSLVGDKWARQLVIDVFIWLYFCCSGSVEYGGNIFIWKKTTKFIIQFQYADFQWPGLWEVQMQLGIYMCLHGMCCRPHFFFFNYLHLSRVRLMSTYVSRAWGIRKERLICIIITVFFK